MIDDVAKAEDHRQHCLRQSIPGCMCEAPEYQAISDLETATVTVHIIKVGSNLEPESVVYLPSSEEPSKICLNYLFFMTVLPVASHVQPLYFDLPLAVDQPASFDSMRQVLVDLKITNPQTIASLLKLGEQPVVFLNLTMDQLTSSGIREEDAMKIVSEGQRRASLSKS